MPLPVIGLFHLIRLPVNRLGLAILGHPWKPGRRLRVWRSFANAAQGVSTRSGDGLVKAMGGSGISKSQVSRLCEEIDTWVKAFLDRPLEGDRPYVWLDATYVKVRRNHRIVSVAAIVAVGVNTDGRREVLGIPPNQAKPTSQLHQMWIRALS